MSDFRMDIDNLQRTEGNFLSASAELEKAAGILSSVQSQLMPFHGLGIESVRSRISSAAQNATKYSRDLNSEKDTLNLIISDVQEADNGARFALMTFPFIGVAGELLGGLENVMSDDSPEFKALVSNLALETGESQETIFGILKSDVDKINSWLKKIGKFTSKGNKILRAIFQAKNIKFTIKGGSVIVSGFKRSSFLNQFVKIFNKGKGIGSTYKVTTIAGKRSALSGIFALDTVNKAIDWTSNKLDKLSKGLGYVEGGLQLLSGSGKIGQILSDNSLTTEEKVCDSLAVGLTSAAAAALEASSYYAGKAVTTAVTAAIPIPVVGTAVGVVAGMAVEGLIGTVADVITSEAVVSQVSDSIGAVGHAVAANGRAVSDAGKRLLESDSVGDAVANTAKLVGTAVVATVDTAKTAVVEGAKVVGTVAVETAKAVGSAVKETGKKVVDFFTSW